jgi:hypothetical protein
MNRGHYKEEQVLTLQEAYDLTEAQWEMRAKGQVCVEECGYCQYAIKKRGRRVDACMACPLREALGDYCVAEPCYLAWCEEASKANATMVVARLQELKEELCKTT